MKLITRKISLENFISRTPGVIQGLRDVYRVPSLSGVYYTQSEVINAALLNAKSPRSIIKNREFTSFFDEKYAENASNYGMVVSDIDISDFSGITDYTDVYINIPTEEESFHRVVMGEDFYLIEEPSLSVINNLKELFEEKSDIYPDITTVDYYFCYGRDIYYIEDVINETFANKNDIINKAKKKKYITYPTLKKWLKFFKEYDALLNNSGNSVPYKNAEEYSKYEENATITYDEAVKMDKLFLSRGGWDFYNFIVNRLFLKLKIPVELTNEWKRDHLDFPDAKKWFGWFNDMHEKYSAITEPHECVDADNCCDCRDYYRLGGNDMYEILKDFILNAEDPMISTKSASVVLPVLLEKNIDDLGMVTSLAPEWEGGVDYGTDMPYGTVVSLPENGKTYLIKGGVGHTGYIYDEYKEFAFNEDDFEDYTKYYKINNADNFTQSVTSYSFNVLDKVIYNPTDDKMSVPYPLTRPINGFVVINDKIYEIQRRRYVIFDNGRENYLINGKKFLANKTNDGRYYVVVNGQTYYALERNGVFYFNFTKQKNCIPKNDYKTRLENEIFCVEYNDEVLAVENGMVTIFDGYTNKRYSKLNGYFNIGDKVYYVGGKSLNEKVYHDYEFIYNEDDGVYDCTFKEVTDDWVNNLYYPKISSNSVNILFPYTVFRCDTITGHTNSKLYTLRSPKLLTDDLGNVMPGYYEYHADVEGEEEWVEGGMDEDTRANSKFFTPYNGARLDLYFKVGNVSTLSKNECLTQENNPKKQYFDGGIIEKMKFYYKDNLTGEIFKNTLVEISNDGFTSLDNEKYFVNTYGTYFYDEKTGTYKDAHEYAFYIKKDNVLSAIHLCKKLGEYFANYEYWNNDEDNNDYGDYSLSENIFCEIEYHINAIVHLKVKFVEDMTVYDGYELEKENSLGWYKYHPGITYTDVYTLTDDVCLYEMYNGEKYSLKYYKLTPTTRNVILDNGDNETVTDTVFSMPVLLYDKDMIPTNNVFLGDRCFDEDNGTYVAPVFRQEYNIGVATPQNVSGDIYIDRGIQKALDKHIRLQEINTMESLENYGNGSMFE
jgi:hypothetical protein